MNCGARFSPTGNLSAVEVKKPPADRFAGQRAIVRSIDGLVNVGEGKPRFKQDARRVVLIDLEILEAELHRVASPADEKARR